MNEDISELMRRAQCVSLDVGMTLIHPHPPVGEMYARMAGRFGYELEATHLDQLFLKVWKEKSRLNRTRKNDNAFAAESASRRFWRDIFDTVMTGLVDESDREALFSLCFDEYARGRYWRLFPEVRDTLDVLRDRGVRMVVLSNWDFRLQKTLTDLGLNEYFAAIYISSRIGAAKPDPRAFLHVAKDQGLMPAAIVHVGDSFPEDVEGARNAGLKAIHLDRSGEKRQEENPALVIHRLSELTV